MIFRKFGKQDRAQLLKLLYEFRIDFHRNKLLKNSPILPMLEYKNRQKTMKKSIEELYDGSHICFLAEEKKRIVGYISGKIIELPHKLFDKEGYIDDWYVKESYRDKGVGGKLYNMLVTNFNKRKCSHVSIGSVYIDNKRVIDIYHHLGFLDFYLTLKKKIDRRN